MRISDLENEELRVQVNTLRYELENIKQERDLTALRHEKELRDLQAKADADFRKAQVGFLSLVVEAVRMLMEIYDRLRRWQAIGRSTKMKL